MSIRNDRNRLTVEAIKFAIDIRKNLKPIFDKYKEQFSYEDMYYLVCTQFNDLILDEILDLNTDTNFVDENNSLF